MSTTSTTPTPPLPALSGGPIFLSGRQHSGNTVLALMLGKARGCYAQIDENDFFERQFEVDNEHEPAQRLELMMKLLRLEHAEAESIIRSSLSAMLQSNPSVASIDLYRTAMHIATIESGNTFWVQKATSYIFHVDTIFSQIPDARMVYLLRNPYDIVASRIRRNPGYDNVWAPTVAWNRGIRIARDWSKRAPDRFRIMQYEHMVNEGQHSVKALCDAFDIPFTPEMLDVPHVNQSRDGKYTLSGSGTGLSKSRTNKYIETCTPAQLHAVDSIIDMEAVQEFYPDLPHRVSPPKLRLQDRMSSRWLRIIGPVRFLKEKVVFHRQMGASWTYILRRLVLRARG
ncbi:MAG: sulfotransferase [Phycisphaeraceae bacterium]|nr:sulfotransferase [Phycisphaerales bacterium]MCB9859410.1 sulfotransferase [Phycisphaeraceae bacterium]